MNLFLVIVADRLNQQIERKASELAESADEFGAEDREDAAMRARFTARMSNEGIVGRGESIVAAR